MLKKIRKKCRKSKKVSKNQHMGVKGGGVGLPLRLQYTLRSYSTCITQWPWCALGSCGMISDQCHMHYHISQPISWNISWTISHNISLKMSCNITPKNEPQHLSKPPHLHESWATTSPWPISMSHHIFMGHHIQEPTNLHGPPHHHFSENLHFIWRINVFSSMLPYKSTNNCCKFL